MNNGVFKRPLVVYERAEKMVVTAGNIDSAVFWDFNCIEQWKRHRTIYLHHFLMTMDKIKTLETSLVLTTGFLVAFLITRIDMLLYAALFFGVTGVLIQPFARLTAVLWFKIAEVLNFVVSGIILSILFFIVLFPIAVLYKVTNSDKLRLKKPEKSNWIEVNQIFTASNLKNTW